MPLRFTIYAGLQFLGGVVSTLVAAAAWRRRFTPTGRLFCHMMTAIAVWSFILAAEAAAVEPAAKITLSKLEYIPLNAAPLFYLAFALAFSDRDGWLTPRRWRLLGVMPALNVLMVFTNKWHRLVWPGFSPVSPATNLMVYYHGPWFWVAVASAYAYNLVASALLLRRVTQRGDLARRQAATVVAAVIVPWAASLLYALGLSPVRGLEITPIAFTFSGAAFWVGLRQFRLLDLIPVARGALIEGMPDGALVSDAEGRIVDYNPAALWALRLGLGGLPEKLRGQQIATRLGPGPAGAAAYAAQADAALPATLGHGANEREYDIQVTALRSGGMFAGCLTLLRDVTVRARAERALRESEGRFRLLAENLPFPVSLSRASDGKLLYVNPQAAKLFCEPAESLIARNAGFCCQDPADRAAIWDELQRSGQVSGREVRLARPDGSVIWTLLSAAEADIEGERVILLALADITARKQIEDEREALVAQLQGALANVKTLRGLVPICANCKKIRDDAGYWQAVEEYIGKHSLAEFTLGICPDCMKKLRGAPPTDDEPRAILKAQQ